MTVVDHALPAFCQVNILSANPRHVRTFAPRCTASDPLYIRRATCTLAGLVYKEGKEVIRWIAVTAARLPLKNQKVDAGKRPEARIPEEIGKPSLTALTTKSRRAPKFQAWNMSVQPPLSRCRKDLVLSRSEGSNLSLTNFQHGLLGDTYACPLIFLICVRKLEFVKRGSATASPRNYVHVNKIKRNGRGSAQVNLDMQSKSFAKPG